MISLYGMSPIDTRHETRMPSKALLERRGEDQLPKSTMDPKIVQSHQKVRTVICRVAFSKSFYFIAKEAEKMTLLLWRLLVILLLLLREQWRQHTLKVGLLVVLSSVLRLEGWWLISLRVKRRIRRGVRCLELLWSSELERLRRSSRALL